MLVHYYVIIFKEINTEHMPVLKYVNEDESSVWVCVYTACVGFFALSLRDSPFIWENVWVVLVIKYNIYFTIATLKQNSKKKSYECKRFLSFKILKSSLLFTLMMCQFSFLLVTLYNSRKQGSINEDERSSGSKFFPSSS